MKCDFCEKEAVGYTEYQQNLYCADHQQRAEENSELFWAAFQMTMRKPETEPDLKTLALEVIEALCCGDFVVENGVAETIYRFAHVARAEGSCPHPDWEQELRNIHAKMRKDGYV
jgi:hypothetical protein